MTECKIRHILGFWLHLLLSGVVAPIRPDQRSGFFPMESRRWWVVQEEKRHSLVSPSKMLGHSWNALLHLGNEGAFLLWII